MTHKKINALLQDSPITEYLMEGVVWMIIVTLMVLVVPTLIQIFADAMANTRIG